MLNEKSRCNAGEPTGNHYRLNSARREGESTELEILIRIIFFPIAF